MCWDSLHGRTLWDRGATGSRLPIAAGIPKGTGDVVRNRRSARQHLLKARCSALGDAAGGGAAVAIDDAPRAPGPVSPLAVLEAGAGGLIQPAICIPIVVTVTESTSIIAGQRLF